jgi:hypothetical protein
MNFRFVGLNQRDTTIRKRSMNVITFNTTLKHPLLRMLGEKHSGAIAHQPADDGRFMLVRVLLRAHQALQPRL